MSLVSTEEVRLFILDYLQKNSALGSTIGPLTNDSFDFLKAGMIDSFGLIEMISDMEDHFHITVDFDQLDPEKLTILGPFSSYVAETTAAGVGSVTK